MGQTYVLKRYLLDSLLKKRFPCHFPSCCPAQCFTVGSDVIIRHRNVDLGSTYEIFLCTFYLTAHTTLSLAFVKIWNRGVDLLVWLRLAILAGTLSSSSFYLACQRLTPWLYSCPDPYPPSTLAKPGQVVNSVKPGVAVAVVQYPRPLGWAN